MYKLGKHETISYILVDTSYRKYVAYAIKKKVNMNIVIIYGEIYSNIDFKFIYNKYAKKKLEKYKHTSIVRCKIRIENNSIVEVYGYDNMADYMYSKLKEKDKIIIEGKIDSNMLIKIESIINIPIVNLYNSN